MSDIELVNIFDDDGTFIKVMNRKQAEAENLRMENVVIHIYNPDGRIWMQQRALDKTYHPGMWDVTVAGGAESHEHRDEAAARETREETGLSLALDYVDSILREVPWKDQQLRRFTHFYIAETDQQPTPNSEVLRFQAWDPTLLLKDMEEHPEVYIPNIKVLIQRGLDYRATKNPSS